MAQTTSLFFQDEVLPGVLTEIQQDYNVGYYTTAWGSTSTVLVLGTAFTGPINKVMKIYSPEHALYVYGNTYDAANHKEASLVTGIQDAYDKGCKAIYACRIAGKEIYKDFELAPDLGYKLRISGAYPSNECKNMYIRFINDGSNLKLIYYKPADRATIYEKMNGVVDSAYSMIETVLDLKNTYGYTADTKISELISLFNTHQLNNVLQLSIIKDGADVTSIDPEARNLPIRSIFDGVYFIGRDKNLCNTVTVVDNKLTSSNPFWSKYTNITTFKTLKANTDINAEYPIAGEYDALRSIFTAVTTTSKFDFIKNVESVNLLYDIDDVDYEQVDISGFDLYKSLGSGYATTAHIELKNPDIQNPTAKDYVVKETSEDDVNRIVAISDGLYTMLQNVPTDYRVLAHASAVESMSAKLPKKTDFLTNVAGDIQYLTVNNGVKAIRITPIIDDNSDISETNTFSFDLSIITDDSVGTVESDDCASTCVAKAIRVIDIADAANVEDDVLYATLDTDTYTMAINKGGVASTIDGLGTVFDGEYFFDAVNNKLLKVSYVDGDSGTKAVSVFAVDYTTYLGESISDNGKSYFIISFDQGACVAKFDEEDGIKLLGFVDQVIGDNDIGFYTVPTVKCDGQANKIILTERYVESNTYESLLSDIKNSKLSNMFTFEYADGFESYVNEYLDSDVAKIAAQTTEAGVFAKEIFDTTKYIPYTTSDNLARQLAQHCTYTSLKTGATHGIIGYRKISDTSITGIASIVDMACAASFDLYAKKNNGRYMLDKDNMPYSIGRNISMPFGCYYVTTADGYKYISNGACGYAGMISALPIEQSSTNQPIDISTLVFELTNYQLTRLTECGYVTFKNSFTKGIVVTDGITMAPSTSEYKRLSTTRIIGCVETVIRNACEPFIGKVNTLARRHSVQTAVNSALQKLLGTLIKDYDFEVTSDSSQQVLGIIDIDYVIVPYYEIRQIRNRITIKDSI